MQLDLALYRVPIEVQSGVWLSVIDVSPERPLHTILLIHGFGGNAQQWQYQIDAFAQQNRVIAIDLRGHGQSTWVTDGYEMSRLLEDITAVLTHLHVQQKFVLAGHSFGVAIATEFAWHYPNRVSHLVLIAGAGEYDLSRAYRAAFHLPTSLLTAAQPLVKNWVDASLPALQSFYLNNVRFWRGWDKFPELQPPTLVIMGNRDQVLPHEAFQRVAELVPQESSDVMSVDVSAHMVMLERRDAVNRAIERFIEKDTADEEQPRWRLSRDVGHGSLLRERPWLAYYEPEVPASIHLPPVPLTQFLNRAQHRFPKRTAIIFAEREISYQKLYKQVTRFANALQVLKVKPGSRILIALPNLPQTIVAYYGTLEAGCVATMVNPLAEEEEIIRQAVLVEADILVTLTKYAATAVAVREQTSVRHTILTNIKDYMSLLNWLSFTLQHEKREGYRLPGKLDANDLLWKPLLRQQTDKPPQVSKALNDTAVIQFSGGMVGSPKAIKLSHRNLVANTLQMRSWLTETKDGAEVALCVVPFSHVFGMTAAMNVPLSQGATLILLPEFKIDELLKTVRNFEPTYFVGVPTMFMAINNFPEVQKFNVRSIRACISGAAPLPVEIEEAFEKLTKANLVEGYGLSEAGPMTHIAPLHGRDKVGSIGLPLPNTEARIVDLVTRRPLPPGQVGELVVRGPQVMLGYWRDEEATAVAIDAHGWLRTNDIGRMDEDGYFQIIGRRQDVWQDSESTETIYPRDIEEVIYELPEVNEVIVAVFAGLPVAFVRLKEHTQMTTQTVTTYCRHRLPQDHVPRQVFFVTEFPRNIIGKVLRRELVESFEREVYAEAGSVAPYLSSELVRNRYDL